MCKLNLNCLFTLSDLHALLYGLLTGTSNAFFSVVEFSFMKNSLFFFLYWKKSITPIPENLLESKAVCIIKRRCDSPTVATQQLAQQQHISWSHTEEWFCVVLCGWRRFFFLNGGGGLLQNLMLEGDPEVPFTSPSELSPTVTWLELWQSRAEGRSVGGKQVHATFTRRVTPTSKLTHSEKQEQHHKEHKPVECELSWNVVNSRMDCAEQRKSENYFINIWKWRLNNSVCLQGYSLSVGGSPPPEQR